MILLGVSDLAKRWNYSKQGVHQKMKNDSTFPRPVAKINKGKILVFLEKDIIQYEQNHRELTDEDYKEWYQKKYCFRQQE